MRDFNAFLEEKFREPAFRREYYRHAAFYRLADQFLLLRKQRGLTQGELAQRAGTTQAVVSRLENASVRPSLDTIVRIADALDAAVDVRVVPLEALQPEDSSGHALEKEDTAAYFHYISEQMGTHFEQPNCWNLLKKSALHPLKATKKIPEYS